MQIYRRFCLLFVKLQFHQHLRSRMDVLLIPPYYVGGIMQYFSHKYFTTMGGKIFVRGAIPLASKNALSVFNQRRKVAGLTPAA